MQGKTKARKRTMRSMVKQSKAKQWLMLGLRKGKG
jgi:hypothetical protein